MRRFLPLLAAWVLGAAVPVLALSGPAPDDAEHNRKLLERYRADPDHYARLLRDLQAFQALPPERQERMRRFDHDLHAEDSAAQDRLWEVLDRYTDWMSRLPDEQQKRIEQAADRNERLAIVKQLRENDWIARLPKKDREDVLMLPEPQRFDAVVQLRQEEHRRRQAWMDWANSLKAKPPRAGQLPEAPWRVLQEFANTELTKEERGKLHLGRLDKNERREVLEKEYFKRHPEAAQKYRRN